MIRSYKYRLTPTRAQAEVLLKWLRFIRELYNAALQERRDAWAKQHVSVSRIDQEKQLPAVRDERPEFNSMPIAVLRGALRQLDKAFTAFFRRCKSGKAPGFPRFKGRDRWNTISIDDLGKRSIVVAGGKRVKIPMLGKVKFKQHRPVEGSPKALRLTIDSRGRWFIVFACRDVPAKLLPATGREVGVDVGLEHLAATSDGELFNNPRPLRAARIACERAQRRVSRRKRGSRRRRIAARLLARQHQRVANIRRERHITIARELVGKYDCLYIEKLKIDELARSTFAKSIHDASWGNLFHWIRVKAEEAGRDVVDVDPRGTSQRCSSCGSEVRKSLADRVHRCPHCGLVLDRDVNAARNILRLGQSLRGAALPVRRRLRSAKLQEDAREVSL